MHVKTNTDKKVDRTTFSESYLSYFLLENLFSNSNFSLHTHTYIHI